MSIKYNLFCNIIENDNSVDIFIGIYNSSYLSY